MVEKYLAFHVLLLYTVAMTNRQYWEARNIELSGNQEKIMEMCSKDHGDYKLITREEIIEALAVSDYPEISERGMRNIAREVYSVQPDNILVDTYCSAFDPSQYK